MSADSITGSRLLFELGSQEEAFNNFNILFQMCSHKCGKGTRGEGKTPLAALQVAV